MGDSNKTIAVPWSDLPRELLERIGNRLDTETDVRRFRAVCTSWRSSTTPFKRFPPTPLNLPCPFAAGETPVHRGAYLRLAERTVYRVQSPEIESPNSWIVKIEGSSDGKLKMLSPVGDRPIKIGPETHMPKVLNTLNFRVSEVYRSYALRYVNPSNPKKIEEHNYAKKVIVAPGVNDCEYVVVAIDDRNKLWYMKSGDEKWTMYTNEGWVNSFSDVVYCKGQFYGVNVTARTWVFDSNFKAEQICYSIFDNASKRCLLELYDGKLYLVEGVTDKDKRQCKCHDIDDGCQCRFPNTPVKNTVVEVKISRIDERQEWVEAKRVNDRVIFIGDDCSFSLSAKEFEGCNGTRVFYADRFIFFRTEEEKVVYAHEIFEWDYNCESDDDSDYFVCDCCVTPDPKDEFEPSEDIKVKFRGLHGHNIGVCDFESGKLGSLVKFPEFAGIFWPPPPWLNGA